ncbi:hypothetical protein [Natrinema sp. CBA1119]|uniref:hypothetical protein n=1 Tax=Natrinema sp. CBA1119 TaxID=1608465 RepID=UPI000BF51955|nr:hypothetical protein [Natrinema sp. CBA1119]
MSGDDDQQNGWAEIGRTLLATHLQQTADELQTAFTDVSRKAMNEDETVTGEDVRRLSHKLEDANSLVDKLAKVPANYEHPPRARDLLSPEALQELTEQHEVDDEE